MENILRTIEFIESQVVGLDLTTAKRNALMNFRRARSTVGSFKSQLHSKDVSCLNLSGLGAGHQDIAIYDLLKYEGFRVSKYTIVDSEQNDFCHEGRLLNMMADRGQELLFNDYTAGLPKITEKYDIVFLCEIIEHLNYVDVLKLVDFASSLVKDDGILILTSPNQFGLINRLSALIGKDNYFDMEIGRHKSKNYYGHIGIFSILRITKIVVEAKLKVVYSGSFNHWRYSWKDGMIKFLAGGFLNLITKFFNIGFTLVVVSKKIVS